jgi:hypothetical protein
VKKTVTREIECCDVCSAEHAHYKCIKCGKMYCYECKDAAGVQYAHGVCFGGTGDGFYCHPCDEKAAADGDPIHRAYRVIRALQSEWKGFRTDFEARCKRAEEELKNLQDIEERRRSV